MINENKLLNNFTSNELLECKIEQLLKLWKKKQKDVIKVQIDKIELIEANIVVTTTIYTSQGELPKVFVKPYKEMYGR